MVKQVFAEIIPTTARLTLGGARCIVLEILNEVFTSGLGISLFESVVSTKEGIEFSVLPAYSGLTINTPDVRQS